MAYNINTQTYEYMMTATYDQWARYLGFYADFVENKRKRGELTDTQVKEIWSRYDKLVTEKIEEAKAQGKPSTTIPGHSYMAPTSGGEPSLIKKVVDGWKFIFDNTGDALGQIGAGLGSGTIVLLGVVAAVILLRR